MLIPETEALKEAREAMDFAQEVYRLASLAQGEAANKLAAARRAMDAEEWKAKEAAFAALPTFLVRSIPLGCRKPREFVIKGYQEGDEVIAVDEYCNQYARIAGKVFITASHGWNPDFQDRAKVVSVEEGAP